MLSMSQAMSAGQAGGYFSREDYYLRDAELGQNSRWCGQGAAALGLEGPVREDDFRALCRGEDLHGHRLVAYRLSRDRDSGELVGEHRAGNDCTFSAPKSVSIAYAAGVDAVKEAHDAAVASVASHLEKHNSLYRSREGLQHGTLVAARFDHATSRNIDPQLHSHLFIINSTRTPDGSWRANEPKRIYQDLKSLGLLYRLELARELEKRGFEIEIRDRSRLFFELKGIDPRLIDHFSSRRKEIEDQVARWRAEGRFQGVPDGRLYEMAALETRDPKRGITRDEVARVFENGFQSCGTSSAEVRRGLERERAAFVRAPELQPELSPGRALELAAQHLTAQEALLERARLLNEAVRISGTRHGLGELEAALDAGVEGVVQLRTDRRGREFYSTRAMVELEAGNLARVRELARAPFPPLAKEHELVAYRDRLYSEVIRPTEGQWSEFGHEVSGSSVLVSVGDPGTVKTGTLGFIERFYREVLEPSGRKPVTINLAYTGKAAREMTLATGTPSFTVDSFLTAAAKFDLQGEISEGGVLEVGGERIHLSRGVPVVVRVDEAGFLGAAQAGELLRVVERLREQEIAVKLHLLGDTKQLQSIAAGDFLRQVEELGRRGELEYTHLTEILRQRDPELLAIAKGLNREDRPLGENAREALALLDKRGEVTEIAHLPELRAAAVDHYLKESSKPSPLPERAAAGERQTVLMVAATNAERRELNRLVREARVAAGEIEGGRPFRVLAPVPQGLTVEGYRLGDHVLFTGEKSGDGRVVNWGARIGVQGEIVALDAGRNLVRVSYSFASKSKGEPRVRIVTREFPADQMVGRTALYREEERSFAVGDRVVALKNDARLDLQNGALGTVKELDEEGRAILDFGGRSVRLDLTRYRHVDHAYAVTIHKSQGATVDRSIMVATVRPEVEVRTATGPAPEGVVYGHASYNALNVAVTRARFGSRVFTNSVAGFTKAVQQVETKTSTLTLPVSEREGVGAGVRDPGRDLQQGLREKIRRFEGSLQRPEQGGLRHSVEALRVPPVPVPELPKMPRELPAQQMDLGRNLELDITKK